MINFAYPYAGSAPKLITRSPPSFSCRWRRHPRIGEQPKEVLPGLSSALLLLGLLLAVLSAFFSLLLTFLPALLSLLLAFLLTLLSTLLSLLLAVLPALFPTLLTILPAPVMVPVTVALASVSCPALAPTARLVEVAPVSSAHSPSFSSCSFYTTA
jgi:hypothetical protein